MIGASALAALATVLVVLAVTAVNRLYARTALPEFYANAINALVATLLAGAVYAATVAVGRPMAEQDFAFIVAGGIVAMLPGRSMASAIEDVLFGFPLTGAGRLLSVLVALMGLIIGIAGGLSVMLSLTTMLGSDFVSPSVLKLGADQASVVAAVCGALVVGLSGAVTVQSLRSADRAHRAALGRHGRGRGRRSGVASASARSPPPGWRPWRWVPPVGWWPRAGCPVDGARGAGQLRAAARSDDLPRPLRAGRGQWGLSGVADHPVRV